MEDLTKLTKKIRAEGLTDNIRSEIRAAHKKLTEATPAPAASTDSGQWENNTSAAQAARDSLLLRSRGSNWEGVLYGHGEKYTHGEVSFTC